MRYLNLPPLTIVLGVMACAGAENGDYPDAVTADPNHYAVAFENDVARILRITYGPGERSSMHHHPAHCAVGLTSETWRMTDPDGTEAESATPVGELTCVEEVVHVAENLSTDSADGVLVEFKDGQAGTWTAEHPDAVMADSSHYAVEFENDAVRIIRISYGPGDRSVMHSHAASCFVAIRDMPTRMTYPDGETEDMALTAGQFICSDAGAHLPQNIGVGAAEGILFEFKGRGTPGGISTAP